MIFIGIDPSLNSTGVTVIDGENKYFYIVKPNKLSKAEETCQHAYSNFNYVLYKKEQVNKEDKYWKKEHTKLNNILNIVKKITEIVNSFDGIKTIVMEGVAYGARSNNLVDLSGLNYLLRQALSTNDLYIFSPSEIKKFASGNGNCNKQIIVDLFLGIFPQFSILPKCDDAADSYFMANLATNITNT